jgi:conjugative relaxase-like TrwC/TraI family protein
MSTFVYIASRQYRHQLGTDLLALRAWGGVHRQPLSAVGVFMLNIGKLGHDAATYYLETVAGGMEDYYLHAGEAPGQWLGVGARTLALRGEVSGEDLGRILDGTHPASGQQLGHAQGGRQRLPGYDLTFRAPKSVSLLFALGEGGVSRDVKAAHEAAVRAALGYLERQAAFGRRRGADSMVPVRGEGFLAASFQHRTSRAGDPLLHHHVLVANLVRDGQGRWGALDGRLIYAHAKTAATCTRRSCAPS